MILLIQVACVLTAAAQTAVAAVIPHSVFYPSDLFMSGHYDAVYQMSLDNSAEVATTLGPANSAEVVQQNSAEVVQQNSAEVVQQNSAEVGAASSTLDPFNSAEVSAAPSTLDPFNSAEVSAAPSTLDPFNSAEVTPKPIRTDPSVDSNQKIIDSNANSETSNNQGGVSSLVGTTPVYPQATNAEQVDQEGGGNSNSAQPDNAGSAIGTAIGTQPFFPQAANAEQVGQEEGGSSNSSQPDNAGSVIGTAVGTQPFFPQTISVGNEKGSGRTPNRPVDANHAIKVSGVEPIFPLLNDDQQVAGAGVEPIFPETNQINSVPNSLRDALAQAGVDETIDDPVLEHAKQYFISSWNLEANHINASFLEVTDVWPEIGMVYMPIINRLSSQIQNSKSVKEAAERLKSMWEERKPDKAEGSSTDGSHVLSVLTDFISAWSTGASHKEDESFAQFDKNEGNAINPPKITPIREGSPPVRNHPANHRPAGGLPTPVHRPAIRQNANSESSESQEIVTEHLSLRRIALR